MRLLNHNQKGHKRKVPCLIGDANSGKTSLFQPLLGLIHHENIATITKQKVFNKAMINHTTEVIFFDKASPSTLEIDDWKILTQGGYTACDVKYKTAKSFINRCPMILTAQQKLQFTPEDQPAMDRRLRNYMFKSLPNPKKKAAEWLRKHPMEPTMLGINMFSAPSLALKSIMVTPLYWAVIQAVGFILFQVKPFWLGDATSISDQLHFLLILPFEKHLSKRVALTSQPKASNQ